MKSLLICFSFLLADLAFSGYARSYCRSHLDDFYRDNLVYCQGNSEIAKFQVCVSDGKSSLEISGISPEAEIDVLQIVKNGNHVPERLDFNANKFQFASFAAGWVISEIGEGTYFEARSNASKVNLKCNSY